MFLRSTAILCAAVLVVGGCGGDASDGGNAAPGEAKVGVATFPSIDRLVPGAAARGESGLRLTAARGEREGGQLVAWVTQGTARATLVTGALQGPDNRSIPASAVRAYIAQPMHVKRGSPAGRSGMYLDPLVPAGARPSQLDAKQRMHGWIDVAVPTDARPGAYRGVVEIRRANGRGAAQAGQEALLATVPLQLEVRRAVIPDRPALGSSIGFDASQMLRFEQVEPGSKELRDTIDRYGAELAAARLSIADVGALPPGTLPGHRGLPGDEQYLQRQFGRRGVASVRIPFYLNFPFDDPLGSDRPKAVAYLRAAARWARENGWLDRSYVYAIDEPDDSLAGDVRELHELVKQADPQLRLLVTREASARAFQGSVDIWVPNVNPRRFDVADVVRERRRGRETWWYPSITTWQPYPTLFIDDLRPAPRALGWLAWRYGVQGFLYWSATHWHEVKDPYTNPATYREPDAVGNGDGVLLYPGGPVGLPGTPVPSIRLLQLRDGIEDNDLLTLVACHGSAADAARVRTLAERVAPSLTRIDPTAAQVEALRDAAFDALDRAERAGRYAPATRGTACET